MTPEVGFANEFALTTNSESTSWADAYRSGFLATLKRNNGEEALPAG